MQLPDGEGKALVQGMCSACHELNLITRSSGYSRQHWRELIATMINLSGTPAQETITQYLATHFPAHDKLKPTLVAGETKIAFRNWTVPQLGQRARDPVQAPDGSIWYCGQFGNVVGRIKPETGEVAEYTLPDKALPHSVTPDRDGNIWYTGNGNGTIGKLDPRTGTITEYKMPDPAAKDPHTAEFDAKGTLWFTLQVSNMIGRQVPSTGEIKLVTVQRKNARPYGIKVAKDGSLWVSCNGSNCVLNVDPMTMAVRQYELPEKTTVRRLDIAGDGMIWYVNSGLGRLGRLDPKDRSVQRVAIAQRRAVSSVRHCSHRWYRLVQRVGAAPRCAGALRPEDREISKLADPLGQRLRRSQSAYAADPRRQSLDPSDRHQSDLHGRSEARCAALSGGFSRRMIDRSLARSYF